LLRKGRPVTILRYKSDEGFPGNKDDFPHRGKPLSFNEFIGSIGKGNG
jgi:hypothetical protein